VKAAGEIRVLSSELANQIAAGEVVERPASVVKELVENSIDAGATEVRVNIEGGGRALIEVRDDGCGMSPEGARRSLERHATSKISTSDDLAAIVTLGFRGEALPSIASVSRLTMTTRTAEQMEGARIDVIGGRVEPSRPAACPAGTEVQVRDLFFNTPARLKFLKREATEKRHIANWLARLALAHPHLHVRLLADGKLLIDAPAATDPIERASSLLGEAIARDLYRIRPDQGREPVFVSGLFSSPTLTRRNAGLVHTFVNGRFVRDKRIQAAIKVAYGTLLDRGTYPVCVLHISMAPDLVDVNVHPTKVEVRFDQPDLVFRAVRAALLDGLGAAPWVPGSDSPDRVYRLRSVGDPTEAERLAMSGAHSGPASLPVQETLPASLGGWWTSAAQVQSSNEPRPPREDYFSTLTYIGKLGSVYLLCQDADGLVVLDQHAAHERVTFEKLRGEFSDHHREIQTLLLPLNLELDRNQRSILEEHGDFFTALGFDLEPFSDDSYVLRAVPALLVGAPYRRLIGEALDEIAVVGHTERLDKAVDAVLSRMACHGSVRAGDRMEPAEVKALLEQMDRIDFRANCPHGRPVYFRISWHELETRFDRK
jgi:DNA mismatch repair protein MutL